MTKAEKFVNDFMQAFDENGLGAPDKVMYLRAYRELEILKRLKAENLAIHSVVRSVWLVQHKETLINHGAFSTEEKARKYFNYNDDSFACVEVELA